MAGQAKRVRNSRIGDGTFARLAAFTDSLAQAPSPYSATAAEVAHEQNRADLARRIAAEVLRRAAEQKIQTDSPALLLFFRGLSDSDRFLIWRAARASKCPSQETWLAAEQLLLARVEGR